MKTVRSVDSPGNNKSRSRSDSFSLPLSPIWPLKRRGGMLVQDNKHGTSADAWLYLPGSLSRVQIILGTKVLFVQLCFGMEAVSVLLLLEQSGCRSALAALGSVAFKGCSDRRDCRGT